MALLLARRGVTDAEEAERFLTPSEADLHDPFLLAGMEEAVARLLAARERREKVAVVGDYDVDGVSATALLLAVFGSLSLEAVSILPHRLRDGYGFQPVHAERAAAEGCRVIVTADCGVSSVEGVQAARERGLDVVITDHHLPSAALPPGALVVNPRQEACAYPFPDLAGVGLALKLALALGQRSGRDLPLAPLLRVACLGTIADLVPLRGENRAIAALGLKGLESTRSAGLKALFQQAGIHPPFRADDVGYRIGPRINAAGRLADADEALELLLTRDEERARQLAARLDSWNRERQGEELRVVEEAREIFARRSPLPGIAVAWSESWHRGVVGIAAGRLARELVRPTLLLSVEGEMATGSGRGIPGVELHGFLSAWRDRLERFGGHAQAVGLSVELGELQSLQGEWEEAAGRWPEEVFRRRHEYELEVDPGSVSQALLERLSRLEPHGQGNPRPLLRVGPLTLSGSPRLFGRGHLSAAARGEDGVTVSLLGWRWQERQGDLAGRFDVLAYLEHDDYRGGPVLRLVDARPSETSEADAG